MSWDKNSKYHLLGLVLVVGGVLSTVSSALESLVFRFLFASFLDLALGDLVAELRADSGVFSLPLFRALDRRLELELVFKLEFEALVFGVLLFEDSLEAILSVSVSLTVESTIFLPVL